MNGIPVGIDEQGLPKATCQFIFLLSMLVAILGGVILVTLRLSGHLTAAEISCGHIVGQMLLAGLVFPAFQILLLNVLIRCRIRA